MGRNEKFQCVSSDGWLINKCDRILMIFQQQMTIKIPLATTCWNIGALSKAITFLKSSFQPDILSFLRERYLISILTEPPADWTSTHNEDMGAATFPVPALFSTDESLWTPVLSLESLQIEAWNLLLRYRILKCLPEHAKWSEKALQVWGQFLRNRSKLGVSYSHEVRYAFNMFSEENFCACELAFKALPSLFPEIWQSSIRRSAPMTGFHAKFV